MTGVQGLCVCSAPAGECRHISKGKDKEVARVGLSAVRLKADLDRLLFLPSHKL